MIQSNTLRIGNLVSYNGNVETILELREHHCFLVGKVMPVEYGLLEPIAITEDILVRMGFEYWGDIGQRKIYKFEQAYHRIKLEIVADQSVAIYFDDELIGFQKNLHSFCNFWFFLTDGDELALIDL